MDTSSSEDEDFVIRRAAAPFNSAAVVNKDFEDSGPVTPPMDHSTKLSKSLGLIMSPMSPPYRRVRSMKLMETPRVLVNRLEPPAFSSTPAASPCVNANQLPRSLKIPRSKGKYDVKDKLNVTMGSVPPGLVNPFSPYRGNQAECKLQKKSRIEKKKIEFDTDDDSDSHDECSQRNIKRPKLSDFDCPKFEREFMVLGVLGSGDHGCVYHCFHLLTGMEYAVKKSLRPINNERIARNEIFAHAALEHPYIVRHYVPWTEEDYVFMQNEYCNGGSLEEYIRDKGPLQEKELMILLEHVAQGLRYIHLCNLAHMDLKPGNIFLKIGGPSLFFRPHDHSSFNEEESKDETTYKIGDLGHVIHLDGSDDAEEGDCRYFPREILNESHLDYSKVDIFSLGLTLYEAAGGGPLPKNGDEWHKIRDGHIRSFPHLSSKLNNLIKKMIDPEPTKRPSACDILEEVCRDEVDNDRELKAAYQKMHLLTDIVKTFSKTVNPNVMRTTQGKRRTINNNIVGAAAPERLTRSTSRLIGKKTPKSMSAC